MRTMCLLILSFLIDACAGPRYTYDFGQHDETTAVQTSIASETKPTMEEAQPEFSASINAHVVEPTTYPRVREVVAIPHQKKIVPEIAPGNPDKPASPAEPKGLDGDVKRAMVFAAGGLVALLIGGNLFTVVGGLSLLIGLIFGIKWLIRK